MHLFISKVEFPPCFPDLKPFLIIASGMCWRTKCLHHLSVVWNLYDKKFEKESDKIPNDVTRESCMSFSKRLQQIIDVDVGYIE